MYLLKIKFTVIFWQTDELHFHVPEEIIEWLGA